MFTFGSASVLSLSACIGMQKMWEEQQVFPGMQGSQLRIRSPPDPLFALSSGSGTVHLL